MKRAIVTGANGFLGSYLVRELLNHHIRVTVVIRSKEDDLSNLPQSEDIRIVYCEAADYAELPTRIHERDAACFFHLAWKGSSGVNRGNHHLQLENAGFAADAAVAAAELGCSRFIGAGSLAEKDCGAYIPLPGSKPYVVSCYGTAKIAAHYISKAVCAARDVEHIWAYLPNSYGPGNYTQNFVNFSACRMLKGERAAFTSGEQLYEFVYAGDTAAGLFAMADKGRPFTSYYIGGKPQPLKDYIVAIRDVIDPAIPLYLGELPFCGTTQPSELFDASALEADTGFTVRTAFGERISETIAWLRNEMEKGTFVWSSIFR